MTTHLKSITGDYTKRERAKQGFRKYKFVRIDKLHPTIKPSPGGLQEIREPFRCKTRKALKQQKNRTSKMQTPRVAQEW